LNDAEVGELGESEDHGVLHTPPAMALYRPEEERVAGEHHSEALPVSIPELLTGQFPTEGSDEKPPHRNGE